MIVSPVVRRFAWVTGLSGLFVVTGLLSGASVTEADQTAESWRAKIVFDFSNGIAERILDQSGQIELWEAAMEGGELIQLPRGDDWAVHFPLKCDLPPRTCPRAILESGPAEQLNPYGRPLSWGASVQIMPNERAEGANVVQKGLSVSGTQYKLQVDGYDSHPSCVISAGDAIYLAISGVRVADGKWHQLACERRGAVLSLSIDGVQVATEMIPPGLSISNDHPLRIGGKGHGPFNDQFHGTIDDVFVNIG